MRRLEAGGWLLLQAMRYDLLKRGPRVAGKTNKFEPASLSSLLLALQKKRMGSKDFGDDSAQKEP